MVKMKNVFGVIGIIVILIGIWFSLNSWTTIRSGHVGISTIFGKVSDTIYNEGFNIVNPFAKIDEFDVRQKTHKESIGVPSKDQLITQFDFSIQYRVIKDKAPSIKKETGTTEDVLTIHMIPFIKSQMRELGKGVNRAEDFFDQQIQQRIQEELLTNLSYLNTKGIMVERVLIRNVKLPKIITDAVARKKLAAQDAEKAKEELKKFKVEQERKEAKSEAEKRAELIDANKKREVMLINANAKLDAAKIEAKSILVIANAKAEAMRKQLQVLGKDGYIKIETLKSLTTFQDGNHMVIMDPNSTNILPFMNLTNK